MERSLRSLYCLRLQVNPDVRRLMPIQRYVLVWCCAVGCARPGIVPAIPRGAASYDGPVIAGHFYHSWEGGGFFSPCMPGGPGTRPPRAWALLRSENIRWPEGRQPDRRREGASTFVLLANIEPLLPGTPQADTLTRPLRATVVAMRPPQPGDCPP